MARFMSNIADIYDTSSVASKQGVKRPGAYSNGSAPRVLNNGGDVICSAM